MNYDDTLPVDVDDDEEFELWSRDMAVIEAWIIKKFKLENHHSLDGYGDEEYPEYISRLLPILRDICISDDEEYNTRTVHEEINMLEKLPKPVLDVSKFEEQFIILSIVSLTGRDDILSVRDDTRYVYTEMCTRFCEWLTTEKLVIDFFGQEKSFGKRSYTQNHGANLQKVIFDKNKYLQSIEDCMNKILKEFHSEVVLSPTQPYNFTTLEPRDTRFFQSIEEWFELDIYNDIELYFRQKKEDTIGLFSQGYRRFAEWGSRYRLMIYCSLIRKTFRQHSQLCFIFDKEVKLRLKSLIDLGQQCLDARDINEDFHDFKVEDIIYEFQNLSQIASLFVNKNCKDVFDHCSALERVRSQDIGRYLDLCLERTFYPKHAMLLSSLSRNSQIKFERIIGTFQSTCLEEEDFDKNLQLYGMWLKYEVEKAINNIENKSSIGVSVVTRRHDGFKDKHMALYNLLGIQTNIPIDNKRGRRTEILFYHKNRSKSKLENEIKYLSVSLNKIMKKFSDTDCVLLAPYLNIISIAHIVQFIQCANSLGGLNDDNVILEFFTEIVNVIGLLEKWGFRNTPWRMHDIAWIFCRPDNLGYNQLLHGITRKEIIEMQLELKRKYDENIKHALHFPELIPPELSPPFEFCISTPKGSAMSVSDGVKHYEISVMEKKC